MCLRTQNNLSIYVTERMRIMNLSDLVNKLKKREETQEEKQKRIEKRAFTKKNRSHKFARKVFFIFFISYGFFLTSAIWLPVQTADASPNLNTKYEVNDNYSVKMIRYDYSEKESIAEIELDIIQSSYNNGEWRLSATQDDKPLNVSFPIDNEQNIIIRIIDIPNEGDPISIVLSFVDNKNEISNVSWNFKPSNVTQVDNLPEKTPNEYRIQRCYLNIDTHNKQISKYQQKIEKQQAIIDDITRQNAELQKMLSQQTSEEQKKTNNQIKSNLTASTAASDKIKIYNQKIITLKSKIVGEQQKIQKLKNISKAN